MKRWHHAPMHLYNTAGTYMITGATYCKQLLFKKPHELDYLHDLLLDLAKLYDWKLEAWVLFPNHYHFLVQSPENSKSLPDFIRHFHSVSAKMLNLQHNTPNRLVWFQYWDSKITYQKSYCARLNYINQNPVRHKIVKCAKDYKWSSVRWFEENAPEPYWKNISKFKIDSVNVVDDFDFETVQDIKNIPRDEITDLQKNFIN